MVIELFIAGYFNFRILLKFIYIVLVHYGGSVLKADRKRIGAMWREHKFTLESRFFGLNEIKIYLFI